MLRQSAECRLIVHAVQIPAVQTFDDVLQHAVQTKTNYKIHFSVYLRSYALLKLSKTIDCSLIRLCTATYKEETWRGAVTVLRSRMYSTNYRQKRFRDETDGVKKYVNHKQSGRLKTSHYAIIVLKNRKKKQNNTFQIVQEEPEE